MCDDVAEGAVELLRARVDRADFEAHHAHVAASETVFDLVHQALRDAPPTMLGRDADGRDVPGVVRLDEADDKADHRATRCDRAI